MREVPFLLALICSAMALEPSQTGLQNPDNLLASLEGPMEFIQSHPLNKDGASRPSAPAAPAPPAAPATPATPSSMNPGVRLLPNTEPLEHSMMMPLLSLPALVENPSRLLSGLAMAPLWDSSEKGMTARNTVFGGMNPRTRDEIIHQNLLSFVMARQLASTLGQGVFGANFKNGIFDWFNSRANGQKPSGVWAN